MGFMQRIPGKKIWPYDKTVPQDKRLVLKNEEKFHGKACVIRSKLEEGFAKWCDKNPGVLYWNSENIAIDYFDPITRRVRKYFPDFFVTVEDGGKVRSFIVEIKMSKETKPPRTTNKSPKVKKREGAMYRRNKAKWQAAELYCKNKGIEFRIVTERSLGID